MFKEKPSIVLKHLVIEAIMRSKLLDSPTSLDTLLDETVTKLTRAFHVQDRLLSEAEVARRWPFLNVKKLQNLRYRHLGPSYHKFGQARNSRIFYRVSDIETWIVANAQLGPYVEGLIMPVEN